MMSKSRGETGGKEWEGIEFMRVSQNVLETIKIHFETEKEEEEEEDEREKFPTLIRRFVFPG